jgi:hypothetical protein
MDIDVICKCSDNLLIIKRFNYIYISSVVVFRFVVILRIALNIDIYYKYFDFFIYIISFRAFIILDILVEFLIK